MDTHSFDIQIKVDLNTCRILSTSLNDSKCSDRWRGGAGGNFKCYRMSVLFYYVYHIYSACGDGFSLFPLRAHTRRPTVARWPPQVYEIGKGCLHTGPARVSCECQEHPDFHPVPGRCDDAGGR